MRNKDLLKRISTVLLIILVIFGMLFTSMVYTFASIPSNQSAAASSSLSVEDGDTSENEEASSEDADSTEKAETESKEDGKVDSDSGDESKSEASKGDSKENSSTSVEEAADEDSEKVTKTDINAFDPYYFANHLSSKYIKANSYDLTCFTSPVTVARAVATYNQNKQSEFSVTESFIAGVEYRIAVYDVDEDSDYYVAKPNVNIGSDEYKLYDVYCGYNTDQGEKINAVYENGILYIPKKAVDDPSNKYELNEENIPLEIQTSYYAKGGVNTEDGEVSYAKEIPIQVTDENGTTKTTLSMGNMFDGYLSVKNLTDNPSDYSASDFAVFLNGMLVALDDDQLTYDSDTGVLSTNVSAATVSNVQVVLKEKSSLSKAASKVKSTILPNVSAGNLPAATNQAGMKYYKNKAGKKAALTFDSSKMFIGWRGYTTTSYLYSGGDKVGKNPSTGNAGDKRYEHLLSVTGGKDGNFINSIKYLYGGSTIKGMWALTSYTAGVNRSDDSGAAIKKASTKIKYTSGGTAKTAYEWMQSYRNNVQQPRQVIGGATKPTYSGNGLGGLTNFAFKFKTSYKGSELSLVSGKSNSNISFDTDYIVNNDWLAASCTHFEAGAGGSEDVKDSKALYVSCIGLTDDYIVLCFTNAVSKGAGQTSCAIYKFAINDTRLDFNIHKTGKLSGDAVSGATYYLYQKSGSKKINGKTKKTNSNGDIDFGKLANGTYYLEEKSAPSGYSKDKTAYKLVVTAGSIKVYNDKTSALVQTITKSSTAFKVTDLELPSIEVLKVDMDDSSVKLKGAEITLVSKGEDTSSYAETVTTGEDGKATFENLNVGTYTLSETKVPSSDYKEFDPVDIEITKTDSGYSTKLLTDSDYVSLNTTSGTTFSYLLKDPKGGSVIIKKVKSYGKDGTTTVTGNDLVAGAEFTLYENEFGDNWKSKDPEDFTKKISSKTTNESQTIKFSGIQPGDYVVLETEVPAHYDDTITTAMYRIVVDEEGNTTATSNSTEGNNCFYGITEDTSGSVKVPTIKMGNYRYADLSFKKTDKKTGEALEGATFTLTGKTSAGETFTLRATSSSTGIVQFTGVPNGTYTMTETGVDENHQKLKGTFGVEVTKYAVTKFTYTDTDGTVTDLNKDGTAEVQNVPQMPRIYVKKVESEKADTSVDSANADWDTAKGLEGATFQIMSSDGTVLETATTGSDGIATFKAGFPDGTYKLKETKAPENYVLASAEKTITVKDGEISGTTGINFRYSKVNEAQVQFGDSKGVTFNFLKFDGTLIAMEEDASASTESKSYYKNYISDTLGIEGVTFTITKAGESVPYDTCTTNAKGMTTFTNALEDGTYYIQETEVPDHVVKSDIKITVVVKNNVITSVTDDEDTDLTSYEQYFDKYEDIYGSAFSGDATYAYPNTTKANLKIIKTDAVSGSKLSGAKFTLSGKSYELTGYQETRETDSDGVLWFKNLESGTYELHETEYPGTSSLKYGGKTYWEVVVSTSSDGTSVNITEKGVVTGNTRSVSSSVSTDDDTIIRYGTYDLAIKDLRKCSINIFKRSAETGELLQGAKYRLVSDDEDYEYSESGTTNENGKTTFEDLIDGTYTLTEIKAPAGYVLGEYVSEGNYITQWKITVKDGKVQSVDPLNS